MSLSRRIHLACVLTATFCLASLAAADGLPSQTGSVVQVGQFWELTAAFPQEPQLILQFRVHQAIRTGEADWHAFGLEGVKSGGDMTYRPSERGIGLTAFFNPSRILRCFAIWPLNGKMARGVLLSGTLAATNEQLRRAQGSTDLSYRELLIRARLNGAGRCTLKRVR
jgi:hypothetical protein